MTRVCSSCGTTVAREECHKNRYGEYICRSCQERGIRFTPRRKARHVVRQSLRTSLRWLAYLAIAALVVGGFYLVIDRMANPPAAAPPE